MLTRTLMLLSAPVFFFETITGVCFCPLTCLTCRDNGEVVRTAIYRPAACNDIESAHECDRANWEIADMQSSLASLVSIFLEDAIRNNNMTVMQAAYSRSLLSLALEDEKPEGDCANGLLTDTPIEDTLAKCFSPELLEQCAMVRDMVDDYQDNIPTKLEGFLGNATMMYNDNMTLYERSQELELIDGDRVVIHPTLEDFIEVVRFRTSIRTARIRCASLEATTIMIAEAGAFGLSSSTGLFLAFLGAASVMLL